MKKESKERQLKHLFALQRLTGISDILEVSRLQDQLRRHELRYHRLSENYCNGVIDSDKFERLTDNIEKKVKELLPDVEGLKFNSDPRGYSLKISDSVMREKYQNIGLETDFGGYGILSPDF